MILLLCFVVDVVFSLNILSFEVFAGIMFFFIIILQLLVLGWVLYIRNRALENDAKISKAIKNMYKHLENVTTNE